MRKFIVGLLSLVMIMFMANVGFAGGSFYDETSASKTTSDYQDVSDSQGGAATGFLSSGESDSYTSGMVLTGTGYGDISATAGALGDSEAYNYNPDMGNAVDYGVGSYSSAEGVTAGSVSTGINNGFGATGGGINGDTEQGTAAGSYVGLAPEQEIEGIIVFEEGLSNPDSYGVTGQYATGSFDGVVLSGNILFGYHSEASASIDSWGHSLSESYEFVDVQNNGDEITYGKGTYVESATTVETSRHTEGHSPLSGSWEAGGGAVTETTQNYEGGTATAYAEGSYEGSGDLGQNYEGSVQGSTSTSVTHFPNGPQGSIMHSEAHMSVSSQGGDQPE